MSYNTNSSKHICIITSSIGFPIGMAGTERVRLLSKCLINEGNEVNLLHIRTSEILSNIRNIDCKGVYQGINFEYTTGTTTRSNSFITRRIVEAKGFFSTISKLNRLKNEHKLDIVYYYGGILNFSYEKYFIIKYLGRLNIPVILDICERPWTLSKSRKNPGILISPISGSSGGVVISKFLFDWVKKEGNSVSKPYNLLKIPILINLDEYPENSFYPFGSKRILFAASGSYDKSLKFIYEVMQQIWEYDNTYKLILTGFNSEDSRLRDLFEDIKHNEHRSNIEIKGYLPKDELIREYARANVLLAPLFDDITSQARFPTKIGEYLASKRPIITNNVGEICEYFKDEENALICPPGNIHAFADKIVKAITNQQLSQVIGENGRRVAVVNFDYKVHSKSFSNFILNQI
jgi:glycosyltransferase involved in cell wall biosynthesis